MNVGPRIGLCEDPTGLKQISLKDSPEVAYARYCYLESEVHRLIHGSLKIWPMFKRRPMDGNWVDRDVFLRDIKP